MSRRLNIHTERRKGWCRPFPPCCWSHWGPSQTADSCLGHEETVSFAGLTRKRGAGENLNAAFWSQAKETWLPAKFDCVTLTLCSGILHPESPLWTSPPPSLNLTDGHIPNWIRTNELEIQPHLHHYIKALIPQKGCKLKKEYALI